MARLSGREMGLEKLVAAAAIVVLFAVGGALNAWSLTARTVTAVVLLCVYESAVERGAGADRE